VTRWARCVCFPLSAYLAPCSRQRQQQQAALTPLTSTICHALSGLGRNYFVAGATNLIDQYGCYGILQDMRLQNSYKSKGVDAVRLGPPPVVPKGPAGIPSVPFVANCTADMVGARKPVLPPYHCDYFGANKTFDFFLQSEAGSTSTPHT
jgi:hypothetical protein